MEGQTSKRNEMTASILFNQLGKALEKQKIYGGRIDYDQLSAAAVSEVDISSFFTFFPEAPKTIEETGLPGKPDTRKLPCWKD